MNYQLIKVCGMGDAQNIREVAALGVNLIGLIFYPKSPRYVESISSDAGIIPDYSSLTPKPLSLTPKPLSKGEGSESLTPYPLSKGEGSNMLDKQLKAEETKGDTRNKQPVSAQLKSTQSKAPFNKVTTPLSLGEGQGGEAVIPKFVGVFVDDMPQNIVTAVYNYHLSYVQLHGDESPVMIDNLRRTLVPDIVPQIKIIKAISVSSAEDLKRCEQYEGHVDLFLFDTKCKGYGGSGQKYDWSVLEAYTGQTPFLLSGGIGPDDADRLRDFHHPQCVGIDLNSKFETAPGMKDAEMLKKFINSLNKPHPQPLSNSLTPLPLSEGEGSDMPDKQ